MEDCVPKNVAQRFEIVAIGIRASLIRFTWGQVFNPELGETG
jgi:hypothetical protein